MKPTKVQVERLTKRFKMYRRASGRLVEWLTLGRATRHTLFTALNDVSFSMRQGEFFGIIGPNGSGKSTLLKILTRVMYPTSGSFHVDGRVTSLLELGTGFNPELTGRQNIVKSARLLGFDEEYIRARQERMIGFADIREYIDQPIKYYSSGMLVRLAFSIFAHVEPDVFIIDEALSVGDVYFSQKCFARLDGMRADGCTVLFVSHDLSAIRKYCDGVMYLHQGQCRFLGNAIEATDMYLEAMSPGGAARQLAPRSDGTPGPAVNAGEIELRAEAIRSALPERLSAIFDEKALRRGLSFGGARIGTGAVEIICVKVCDDAGAVHEHFARDVRIHVHVLARVVEDVEHATIGIQAANRLGMVVWGTNQQLLTGRVTRLRANTWSHAHFAIEPGLGVDEYTLDIGYGDAAGEGHVFDRLTGAARIQIMAEGPADFVGAARVPCTCEVAAYDARRSTAVV